MAESYDTDVDGISEDEQEFLNEKLIPTIEYPDLDYVPDYPWLGERDSTHDEGLSFYERPTRYQDTRPDFLDDALQQDVPLEELGSPSNSKFNTYHSPYTGKDPNDLSLDPDFQFSDDGTAYVPGNTTYLCLFI